MYLACGFVELVDGGCDVAGLEVVEGVGSGLGDVLAEAVVVGFVVGGNCGGWCEGVGGGVVELVVVGVGAGCGVPGFGVVCWSGCGVVHEGRIGLGDHFVELAYLLVADGSLVVSGLGGWEVGGLGD